MMRANGLIALTRVQGQSPTRHDGQSPRSPGMPVNPRDLLPFVGWGIGFALGCITNVRLYLQD